MGKQNVQAEKVYWFSFVTPSRFQSNYLVNFALLLIGLSKLLNYSVNSIGSWLPENGSHLVLRVRASGEGLTLETRRIQVHRKGVLHYKK